MPLRWVFCKAELSPCTESQPFCLFAVLLTFKDMDIDEGQEGVEEEVFEQEAKKVAVRSRSRTHSRSRSRFYIIFKSSV